MDFQWRHTVNIEAPVEYVYRYLAEFPRHCEWAQTLERMEIIKDGDEAGIGAHYRTFERQAMQVDRRPREPLTKGEQVTTLCEVRELSPFNRIIWHGQGVAPKGVEADFVFNLLADDNGGTQLIQTITFRTSKTRVFLNRFRATQEPTIRKAQLRAQWESSLRNIKLILEDEMREQRRAAYMYAVDESVVDQHIVDEVPLVRERGA